MLLYRRAEPVIGSIGVAGYEALVSVESGPLSRFSDKYAGRVCCVLSLPDCGSLWLIAYVGSQMGLTDLCAGSHIKRDSPGVHQRLTLIIGSEVIIRYRLMRIYWDTISEILHSE